MRQLKTSLDRMKASLDERVRDRAAVERALRAGVREALLQHKKLGQPIVV